jgi:raffinose/stachyose/melibiose transport system substrate-binding protein
MNTTLGRAARSALAVLAVSALTLTGCSGSPEQTPAPGKTTASQPAPAEDVTLTFSSWLPTQDQWTTLIAEFEKENPGIDIKFSRDEDYAAYLTGLDNAILAGEVPDLYGIQVGSSFDDYADYALDVNTYAADWIGNLNQEAVRQTTTTEGTVAAVPLLLAGMEFYLYNQTIFDSLVAVSKAARDAGYSPFAMGAADAWHTSDFFVWLSNQYGDGGDIYKAAAGEIPWESPSLVAAATTWQKLFTDGVFQDGATSTTTYPSARDDYFLAGKSIAFPTGSWHVGAALSTSPEVPGSAVEGDALGMAEFPTLGDKDAGATSGVDFAIAVSSEIDDAKKDAAAKFVQFMAVGAGQQQWVNTLQGFPVANGVSIELGADESELATKSVDLVTKALQESTFARKLVAPGNESLETDLGVVLQNIAGGADPAKELATLNR